MKKLIEWIKSKFRSLFKKNKSEKIVLNDDPIVFASNISYISWIESVERQVQQVKIDYALGWICKEVYETHMLEFQNEVKEISKSYLDYLKRNSIPISHDIVIA